MDITEKILISFIPILKGQSDQLIRQSVDAVLQNKRINHEASIL